MDKCTQIALAVVASLLLAPVAMADTEEERWQRMEDRMRMLEDRLETTTDQLNATQDDLEAANQKVESQEAVISKVKMAEESSSIRSGMGSFLQSIDVSFAMAASYWWNFNDPGDDMIANANTGTTINLGIPDSNFSGASIPFVGIQRQGVNAFHPDHNSFALDYGDLRIQKAATKESRAGFRFDFMFGKQAQIMNAANEASGVNALIEFVNNALIPTGNLAVASTRSGVGDDYSSINIPFAYIEWAPPIESLVGPEDVNYSFKAGRFPTYIGQENLFSYENWFISHSNVYHLLQPINHEGVRLDANWGNWDAGVAVVNETTAANIDANNQKTVTWTLGYNGFYENEGVVDNTFVKLNGLWGSSDATNGTGGNSDQHEWILDSIVGANFYPFGHKVETYADFTYRRIDQRGGATLSAWGLTTAARREFTDRLSMGFRFGVVNDDGDFINGDFLRNDPLGGFGGLINSCIGSANSINEVCDGEMTIWSSTLNVDYLLTEHLNLRVETRWDGFRGRNFSQDNVFASQDSSRIPGDPTSTTLQQLQGIKGDRNNQFLAGAQLIYTF